MRVLVVGAGGFLGRQVVAHLAAAGGFSPVAGVRRPDAAFAAAGIETRQFDAADPRALGAALAGINGIVNCVMTNPAAMVTATRALLAGAEAAGVARFVHLSSIAVYGGATGRITEDSPFTATPDSYGAAKIGCEALVGEAAARGLETVVLRPGLIHGPHSQQWTARIGRLLVARRLGDLGRHGEGSCNLIFVDDVAKAIVTALGLPGVAGRSFNLCPTTPPSWNRYLLDFARALGAIPVHRLPDWQLKLERKVLAMPLKLAERVQARLGFPASRLPDALTPGLARLFTQDVTYRTRAADMLFAGAETPYEAALGAAASWFIQSRTAARSVRA